MQPLDPSHVQGLKEELERLKQAFHQEQLRMQRKFVAQSQQLKACTQSLENLQLDKTTDHGSSCVNDSTRSPSKAARGRTSSHPSPTIRPLSQPPLKSAAQKGGQPPRGPAPRCGPGPVFGRRPTRPTATVSGSRFSAAHRGPSRTTSASCSSDSPCHATRTPRSTAPATTHPSATISTRTPSTTLAKPRVPLKEAVVRCEQHTQRLASRVAALEAEQQVVQQWRSNVEELLAGREQGQQDLRETLTGLQAQTERLQESHRKVKEYLNVLTEMVSLEESLSADLHSTGASDKPLRTPCGGPSLPLSFRTPEVCLHPATFIPFDAISPDLSTHSTGHTLLNSPPGAGALCLVTSQGFLQTPAALMGAERPPSQTNGPTPRAITSTAECSALSSVYSNSNSSSSSNPALSPTAIAGHRESGTSPSPAEDLPAGAHHPHSRGPRRRHSDTPSGGPAQTPPPSRVSGAAVVPDSAPPPAFVSSPFSLPDPSLAHGSGPGTPLSLPASASAGAEEGPDLSPPPPPAMLLYQNYEELKRRYQQMQQP